MSNLSYIGGESFCLKKEMQNCQPCLAFDSEVVLYVVIFCFLFNINSVWLDAELIVDSCLQVTNDYLF